MDAAATILSRPSQDHNNLKLDHKMVYVNCFSGKSAQFFGKSRQ